mmetsp:Transcript_162081/g.393684  ORF Transcript_162081/g.393684 Transcript_162081/m.393684 type:complete len:381 (+) Transcript_162081:302-1444(+)
MQHLRDYDSLHQLMLSAIFLHWSLYAPLPPSRRITRSQWIDLNAGVPEAGDPPGGMSRGQGHLSEDMRRMLTRIYHAVNQCFFPQLQIWLHKLPGTGTGGRSSGMEPPLREPTIDPQAEDVHSADGWGLLVGCSLPAPAGTAGNAMTYRHIRSILSEATSTTMSLVSPATSRDSRPGLDLQPAVHSRTGSRLPACGGSMSGACGVSPILEAWPLGSSPAGRSDQVWLSMRHGLLFLAPKPSGWAPYAFLHLRDVVVQDFDRSTLTVSLAMKLEERQPTPKAARKLPEARDGRPGAPQAPAAAGPQSPLQLQLVFLLPDGRWQLLDVPQLQVQLLDAEHMDAWRRELEVQCQLANSSAAPADTGGSADPPPPGKTKNSQEI